MKIYATYQRMTLDDDADMPDRLLGLFTKIDDALSCRDDISNLFETERKRAAMEMLGIDYADHWIEPIEVADRYVSISTTEG